MGTVKLHLCRWCILPLLFLSCSAFAEKPLSSVADLRYGAALYEYYQGNYLDALTELMIAEQRGGIKGHGDNPKLIEGGISLSFGMEQKAGDIFSELLVADENGEFSRPLEVRNAAWFYLGKLRYLRGDWDGTDESFKNIGGRFDPALLSELESLAINLSIRQNQLEKAEGDLARARYVDDMLPYLYYNLGNAYSRQQQYDKAIEYYNKLIEFPFSVNLAVREEQLVLYDRALTAAGYAYVLQGQPEKAIEQFLQVRLDSPFSDRALLGYGWAAFDMEDYTIALKPWQELSRRSLVFATTQEAIIAVPYTYEKLRGNGEALQAYLSAEGAFEKEIARIDEVMAEIDELDLLAAFKIDETDERNWFLLDENAGVKPHLTYLTELFSLNRFQGAVQELRDLLNISAELDVWHEKLESYEYMLDIRQIYRDNRIADIQQRGLNENVEQLMVKRDVLDAEYKRIIAERDYFSLVKDDEDELVSIVERMERNIDIVRRAGEPTDEYEEQLRRFKGLVTWQASYVFSEKSWELKRAIGELDGVILESLTDFDRFNRVVEEEPDIAPYRRRIDAMQARLDVQLADINSAVEFAENELRGQVQNELASQKLRLQHYMSQARLSVARLYDEVAKDQQP
ncbi:tetratricopeptide repeat protein [Aurantivibrio infirmus]